MKYLGKIISDQEEIVFLLNHSCIEPVRILVWTIRILDCKNISDWFHQ